MIFVLRWGASRDLEMDITRFSIHTHYRIQNFDDKINKVWIPLHQLVSRQFLLPNELLMLLLQRLMEDSSKPLPQPSWKTLLHASVTSASSSPQQRIEHWFAQTKRENMIVKAPKARVRQPTRPRHSRNGKNPPQERESVPVYREPAMFKFDEELAEEARLLEGAAQVYTISGQ